MSDLGIHVWTGASGEKYRYGVYMYGTMFGPGPGLYVYARETKPGQYIPVLIGQTEDLSAPFSDPVASQCLKSNRVTHVHVRLSNASEEIRRAERSDLIQKWKPPCNAMG